MKKLKLAFFIFSIFLYPLAQAQSNSAELIANLKNSKDDTSKVTTLLEISKSYFGISSGKSISYAELAKSLSKKINYKKGIALSYKCIGIANFNEGSYIEALQNYKQSLDVFASINDSIGVANMYSNMGNVYYYKGEDFKALDLYFKSLKIAELLGDKLRIASANANIGAVYIRKRSTYYKAIEFNLNALKIAEQINDKNILGTAAVNLGELYLDQGNTELALSYLQKSLKATEGTEIYASSLIAVGKVYSKKREYEMAIQYFKKAYDFAKSIDAKLDITAALIEMGKVYEKTKEYKKALVQYNEAEKLASKLEAVELLKSSYEGLANSFGTIADFRNAFKYQKLLTSVNDTLYNIESTKKQNNLQFNYDLEKKQSEINLLQKEKELTTKEIKNKQTIQFALLAFLAAVSGLLVFVYRFYIIKKKSNVQLEQKNKKIESQKSEITKSIEYAKKIQDAMLPEEDLIAEVLFNSFLIYKPKDIVSGDFYVCINENKKIFLAVADCTGHGVPGALMSMIGSNILNKLITDKGLTEPTEILEQLNSELIVSLKQNKNEGNDGMDIALCVIDFGAGNLKFAGAYRPLWMIRNHELVEIKGSKFPIGGHQIHDERFFKTHSIPIYKTDRFYIFTDGFADQFGGAYGKKLTTKKLKEYVLSTHTENIKNQGTSLSHFLEIWKGKNEQLDDVCFIGFEVS